MLILSEKKLCGVCQFHINPSSVENYCWWCKKYRTEKIEIDKSELKREGLPKCIKCKSTVDWVNKGGYCYNCQNEWLTKKLKNE